MRAGFTVFPISPRNSATAVAHLLQIAQVDHILVGHELAMQELVTSSFDILRRTKETIPSTSSIPQFKDLYGDSIAGYELLPPMGTKKITDTAIILHSSGKLNDTHFIHNTI